MQRTQTGPEPTGHPEVKPQPSPSKGFTPPVSEPRDIPAAAKKDTSKESSVMKEEAIEAPLDKKETPKVETALSSPLQKTSIPPRVSVEKKQVLSRTEKEQDDGVSGQQHPAGKSLQVQPSQKTKKEIKAAISKQEEAGKPQQPPLKATTAAAKSAPPPAQPAKQESGGFFGFGGPKTQAAKSAESVTGKMRGFGSSIFSSASTLITSAVQDEPKTTPPTPRKTSTVAQVSDKATPPVSPKIPQVKETRTPTQKSETPQPSKVTSSAPDKEQKALSEPSRVSPKGLSTCPVCKVELNLGTEDPPNYNTCTECKNTVCNLCGFNPTPHTGAVSAMDRLFIYLVLKMFIYLI